MGKKIILNSTPIAVHSNTPSFYVDEQEALIFEKGYKCIYEKALQCPCKGKGTDILSTCKNCGGIGWLFINAQELVAILYNMNENTTYKPWTQENIGMVNITVPNKYKLCFMDRLTLIESEARFNEVRFFRKTNNNILFTYCSYNIKHVEYAYLFIADNQPLQLLVIDDDFTFENNKLFLNAKFLPLHTEANPLSVTITYIHKPQYHIIDLHRQVANSKQIKNNVEILLNLPLASIGRRAHFVFDTQNIAQNNLFDNSNEEEINCSINTKIVSSVNNTCS